MKKNPNELIIKAIKVRQSEMLEKNLYMLLKQMELPPNLRVEPAVMLLKTAAILDEVAKLQRMKRELTPKPKLKPGGTVPKMLKIEFMNKDEKLYIKNPLDKA